MSTSSLIAAKAGAAERKKGFVTSPPVPRAASRRVSVREGYELWAPTYDSDPNPLVALEERILKPLLVSSEGKDVLDAACGTGRWLEIFLGRDARSAYGIDLSSSMLEKAAVKPGLRNHLIKGDCLAFPFRSGVADIIICSFAVSHLAHAGVFAEEMARVARPGADIYITDLHPQAYQKGWRTAFRTKHESVEIENSVQTREQIGGFESQGLKLSGLVEPHLGQPEKHIFEEAGKSHLFAEMITAPAIEIWHFTRSLH